MRITREEILKVYQEGPDAVVTLVQGLCVKLEYLDGRLAKDSHNSHKPPSSDGPYKPAPKSRRQPTGRAPGGQPGHKGHTLTMVDNPSHVELHRVDCCSHCGRALHNVRSHQHEKRQEFELPEIKVKVTEHQVEIKDCPYCGHHNRGTFPEHIQQPVQYGDLVKSLAVYLGNYQFLPYDRMAQFFKDVFTLPISQGTLVTFNGTCYHKLEPFEVSVKEQLIAAPVVHFDESGLQIKGKTAWLHSASTPNLTYYQAHQKRGTEAMDAINILPRLQGRAIHDCWAPYFDYDCAHGLCNSHLVRELIFVYEYYHQAWAQDMITCLVDMNDAVNKRKQVAESFGKRTLTIVERRYDNILKSGFRKNAGQEETNTVLPSKRGRRKQTKPKNLLDRMKRNQKEILAFVYDFTVPFDNNLAERDIRMMKVQQKISGTFRSEKGADIFCRIRGYVSTVRKNSQNILEAIQNAFKGKPFIPATQISPPS